MIDAFEYNITSIAAFIETGRIHITILDRNQSEDFVDCRKEMIKMLQCGLSESAQELLSERS